LLNENVPYMIDNVAAPLFNTTERLPPHLTEYSEALSPQIGQVATYRDYSAFRKKLALEITRALVSISHKNRYEYPKDSRSHPFENFDQYLNGQFLSGPLANEGEVLRQHYGNPDTPDTIVIDMHKEDYRNNFSRKGHLPPRRELCDEYVRTHTLIYPDHPQLNHYPEDPCTEAWSPSRSIDTSITIPAQTFLVLKGTNVWASNTHIHDYPNSKSIFPNGEAPITVYCEASEKCTFWQYTKAHTITANAPENELLLCKEQTIYLQSGSTRIDVGRYSDAECYPPPNQTWYTHIYGLTPKDTFDTRDSYNTLIQINNNPPTTLYSKRHIEISYQDVWNETRGWYDEIKSVTYQSGELVVVLHGISAQELNMCYTTPKWGHDGKPDEWVTFCPTKNIRYINRQSSIFQQLKNHVIDNGPYFTAGFFAGCSSTFLSFITKIVTDNLVLVAPYPLLLLDSLVIQTLIQYAFLGEAAAYSNLWISAGLIALNVVIECLQNIENYFDNRFLMTQLVQANPPHQTDSKLDKLTDSIIQCLPTPGMTISRLKKFTHLIIQHYSKIPPLYQLLLQTYQQGLFTASIQASMRFSGLYCGEKTTSHIISTVEQLPEKGKYAAVVYFVQPFKEMIKGAVNTSLFSCKVGCIMTSIACFGLVGISKKCGGAVRRTPSNIARVMSTIGNCVATNARDASCAALSSLKYCCGHWIFFKTKTSDVGKAPKIPLAQAGSTSMTNSGLPSVKMALGLL